MDVHSLCGEPQIPYQRLVLGEGARREARREGLRAQAWWRRAWAPARPSRRREVEDAQVVSTAILAHEVAADGVDHLEQDASAQGFRKIYYRRRMLSFRRRILLINMMPLQKKK